MGSHNPKNILGKKFYTQKNLTRKLLIIVKSKAPEKNNTQNQSIKRNAIKRMNKRLEEDGWMDG